MTTLMAVFQSPRKMHVLCVPFFEHTFELWQCVNGQLLKRRKFCLTQSASRVLVMTLSKTPVLEVGLPVLVVKKPMVSSSASNCSGEHARPVYLVL